ncbi:hypothetical protein DFH28DRAFT_914290 [Melampsora americana]|nr:hypothetical protein DFH28DRAFT_914290 [Melampsora americana]
MWFESLIRTFRFPNQSITCEFPSYGLMIKLVPLWFQCSLLHIKFSNSFTLRSIRFLITPLNVLLALSIPIDYCFLPREKSGLLNLYLSVWSFHYATKSIEWGISGGHLIGKYWSRIASESPLLKSVDPIEISLGKEDNSWTEVIGWTTEHFFSPRGLQYGWGQKIQHNSLSALKLLQRLFMVNLVMSVSLAFLTTIGIPAFVSRRIIAEGIGTLCYGLFLISAIDTMFTQFDLLCHLVHWLSNFLPIPSIILRILNPTLSQPVFDSPHTATSLEWFWGKGWHQLFRRNFLICGALPLSGLIRKFGGGFKLQKLFGLFGAFFVSGVMHEYIIHGIAHKPHPFPHIYFHEFPSSFLFFLVQPIGIILEPMIIPHIPRQLGGGWIWVLIFILLTATPFRKQYAENLRLIDDGFKPLKVWNLSTVFIPTQLYNF